MTYRTPCARLLGQCAPVVWDFFSTSGFHRFFATKPLSGSETSKAERRSNLATIVLIRDSWPISFFWICPRGPRSSVRLGARSTQRLNLSAETRSRTRVSRRTPRATAREIPRRWSGLDQEDTQALFVDELTTRCWASKHAPLFHTINTMVAIFLAKVRRASCLRSGDPWSSKTLCRTPETAPVCWRPRSPHP